jgi:hypothetical protein
MPPAQTTTVITEERTMLNETMTVTEESQLDDTNLETVAGGVGILEGILVAAAGAALWDLAKEAYGAFYEWADKANHPPYTRA